MMNAAEFKGKKFRFNLFGYRVLITTRVLDYCKNGYGRTIVFPWARWLK